MLCWTVRILSVINIAAILFYVALGLLTQNWGRAYVLPAILTGLLPWFFFSQRVWDDRITMILLQISISPVLFPLLGFIPVSPRDAEPSPDPSSPTPPPG